MATILQTLFSDAFSQMKVFNFDRNFTEFVPKGPIDSNPALV